MMVFQFQTGISRVKQAIAHGESPLFFLAIDHRVSIEKLICIQSLACLDCAGLTVDRRLVGSSQSLL